MASTVWICCYSTEGPHLHDGLWLFNFITVRKWYALSRKYKMWSFPRLVIFFVYKGKQPIYLQPFCTQPFCLSLSEVYSIYYMRYSTLYRSLAASGRRWRLGSGASQGGRDHPRPKNLRKGGRAQFPHHDHKTSVSIEKLTVHPARCQALSTRGL